MSNADFNLTVTMERVYRDRGTLKLTGCYESDDEDKRQFELTSMAKMLLELAAERGELRECPDVISEIVALLGVERGAIPVSNSLGFGG